MVARVTNRMMTNTLMNNLNTNLGRVDLLQNQLSSGRRFAHISCDPSALIYAQSARNSIARTQHFLGMVGTAQTWLTQAETGVRELNRVIGNVYEELVSAGGTKSPEDKQILGMVVQQMKDHFVDTLNSAFGDRFVFGGFNTPGDPAQGRGADGVRPVVVDGNGNLLFNGFNTSIFDGMPAGLFNNDFSGMTDAEIIAAINADADLAAAFVEFMPDLDDRLEFVTELGRLHNMKQEVVHVDVGPGIEMAVTMNGMDVLFYNARCPETGNPIVRNMFSMLQEVHSGLNEDWSTDELTALIRLTQDAQNHLLMRTAEIGGRQIRLEMLEGRYEQDILNFGQMRSDAEDADIAEVILNLKMAETVYQAALSAGARIIQPTLMDFLR